MPGYPTVAHRHRAQKRVYQVTARLRGLKLIHYPLFFLLIFHYKCGMVYPSLR
jgi:hypothetical protein